MTDRLLKMAAISAAAAILAGCEVNEAPAPADLAANAAASAGTGPIDEPPLARTAADPALQWGPCPDQFPAGCAMAVLHGDPDKPNADIFLKVPGGAAIPAHAHTSAERMMLASGTLRVKYRDHPEATLQPGTYAYGPAALPHRANCAAGAECILFVAFEGPIDIQPFTGAM